MEALRLEVVERLERAEAEGREQRDLLTQVTSELLASWLPIGRQPPEKK